jgi:hypothetical protein
MAAFTPNDFTLATIEQDSYDNRVYSMSLYLGSNTTTGNGQGPIPYCTRYSPSGSVAFLYLQADRTLVSSGAMTTTTNYTINGTSPPTVTAVAYTTNKSYIRLTLSGILTLGNQYSVSTKDSTFGDGNVFNVVGAIPIYIDYSAIGAGIAETINVGSPAMSHT